MIDFDKIKEAATRVSGEHEECLCTMCTADRRFIASQVSALVAEIERLQKYERGELIPGKVVSDNLAAAQRWRAEAYEECVTIVEEMRAAYATSEIVAAIRERGAR